MNAKWFSALPLVAVMAVLAQAQTTLVGTTASLYGQGKSQWPYYSYSSTAAEGVARGIAEGFRGAGEYNALSSEAAVNFSEARRRQIENDKAWVQNYFEMREINREARDAELKRRRGTAEDWARYAQAAKPKPLASRDLDASTGKIHWPILLTSAEFSAQRAELEKAFADRAYHGVLGTEAFLKVTETTEGMLAGLKAHVRKLPPDKYMEARRFLESLTYEASQPVG